MGRFTPIQAIRDFGRNIAREVAQLEYNILRKINADNLAAFGPFTVVGKKTGAYAAKPWEIVLCDPTAGGFTVSLPNANASDAGEIRIANDSASANTITIKPSGSSTVGRAVSIALAAAGLAVILYPDAARNDWVPVSASTASVTMGGEVSGPSSNAVIAKLQGKALDTVAPTLAGQTIYYDGTKWVSGNNSFPYWRQQVANANTVALWQFDPSLGVGGLGDSGTNGLTLSAVGASTARYIENAPGLSGIIVDSLGQFERANNAALNALTDAITLSCVVTFTEIPAAGSLYEYLVTYEGNAETANTNYLFSLGIASFAAQAGAQVDFFWEHGAGIDVDNLSVSSAPIYRPIFLMVTRSAASGGTCIAKFYVNGVLIKTITGLAPADTGGAPSQVLTIGGTSARPSTLQGRAWLSTMHIENVERSASEALTRYNYVARGIG